LGRMLITPSQKTSHFRFAIIFILDINDLITIIFGTSDTDKVRNQMMLCFRTSHASALPCETGNPEDSVMVHCACNTVQLLQRYRFPFS